MATRCEQKACPYYAVEGEKLCLQHRPARVLKVSNFEEEGYAFVSMNEVPTNARYNEAAGKLYAAVKVSTVGNALKVSMKTFKKVTLNTARRYALEAGLRIGVRVVGEVGYLWKLNDSELKAVAAKGDRMRAARAKKGKKPVTKAA